MRAIFRFNNCLESATNMKGSVKIKKVFSGGREELVCEDHNILTDGLGVGVVNLFSDRGSSKVEDHVVGYFQVGTGRLDPDGQDVSKAKYISTLSNPLNEENLYGDGSETKVDTHKIMYYHKTNFAPNYSVPPGVDNAVFAHLPDAYSTSIIDGVVNYRLVLTEAMANDLDAPITEFGLFSRDAEGNIRGDQSVLVAYKNFPENEGVTKTSDFSLVIDWQLKFVDEPTETNPLPGDRSNVVIIMMDDVGIDQLGVYDELNPYDLANTNFADASPFPPLDNAQGSSVYPYTPALSAIAASGVKFVNFRAQPMCSPTRAALLTGKYNFGSRDYLDTGDGFWGPGFGMVADASLVRTRGGLKGLNSEYPFLQNDGEYRLLSEAVADVNGADNTIAKQKVFAEYMHDPGMLYQAAMFGKWHLAFSDEKVIYCEDANSGDVIKGDGWAHIKDVGKWDYYAATFSNLNGNVVPGFKYLTGSWKDSEGWPHFLGSAASSTDGKQMGYVNFFANINGDLVTVSDAGYTTFKQAASGMNPQEGDPSSFTTNYIFSAASAYFNTATEPFFMYISPNMPHTPYTQPHSEGVYTKHYKENNRLKVLYRNSQSHVDMEPGGEAAVSATWESTNAMLENFDYVLSAFLDGLNENKKQNTIFIITSDNGSVVTDMNRRGAFCSSIGLGELTGSVAPFNSGGSAGFGATYDKMLNLGAYGSALDPPQFRRGGENDSPNGFKASLYDRGMLVPMIVSGGSNTSLSGGPPESYQGRTTSALADITDILATVVDIGGGDLGSVPSDSISFYDILKGTTNASSHARQYSFGEIYFPIGNSTGNTGNYGTETGLVGACLPSEPPAGDAATTLRQGDPTVPRTRRSALTIRFEKDDFVGFIPPALVPTLNYCVQLGIVEDTTDISWSTREEIPEASAGVWKIIRPGSGRINLPGGYSGNVEEGETLGKGRWYEELYHLQKQDFTGADLYELHDLIPEEYKGTGANGIVKNLIVSAVSSIGGSGELNNTNEYWNLSRIFEACHSSMAQFLSKRWDPAKTLNEIILQAPDLLGEPGEGSESKSGKGDSKKKY